MAKGWRDEDRLEKEVQGHEYSATVGVSTLSFASRKNDNISLVIIMTESCESIHLLRVLNELRVGQNV